MSPTLHEPKSYQAIMVSSTFTDLEEHRQKVIKAIDTLGYRANVMENDGARADVDVIESSLKMVRDSAAYVGVISLKYGQTPFDPDRNPDRLSITELEFNEAMRLNRPIVLFIMGETHPVLKADVELDPDRIKKLDAFRERAKRMRVGSEINRVYAVFESLEQFSAAAAVAIGRLVQHLESSGRKTAEGAAPSGKVPRPVKAMSNVPINVPFHFLGRGEDLASIDAALNRFEGRVAIIALHGLRGVGKSTLAAAYADLHREEYQVTWWIRAHTEPTMRADLVSLGVRLAWVKESEKEEPSIATVLERLHSDGQGFLLIYDNAVRTEANTLQTYLPRGGAARVLITSTDHALRGLAEPVEIRLWPQQIGARYLIARSGQTGDAEALSLVLGGLPLAHEQAAAYCEELRISLDEYRRRFDAKPAEFLDQTAVAKTFALAIGEAGKSNAAAELLIVHAALLAPEPIPLFVFSETREQLGEPLGSSLAGPRLDDAVRALLAFALVDRERIPDEREPEITTDCIRLHRLVRQVASVRFEKDFVETARGALIKALAAVYPRGDLDNPETWPRARRLDALAVDLVAGELMPPDSAEIAAAELLQQLAAYRQGPLAEYKQARALAERALAIREKALGAIHPDTATSLGALGYLLELQDDLAGGWLLHERALSIREKALGPNHPDTAKSLNNLARLLQARRNFAAARAYHKRALAIREKALGPHHLDTANSLNNFGSLLQAQRDFPGAQKNYKRALAIFEKQLRSDHPDTAWVLNNLGTVLDSQKDFAGARSCHQRALAIRENALGPNHPDTANSLNNLASLSVSQGDLADARLNYERALDIFEKKMGVSNPNTRIVATNLVSVLRKLKLPNEAKALRLKFDLPN